MSKNDITGDKLISKVNTSKFDEGFERIFGKKPAACAHDWCSDGDVDPEPGEVMIFTCCKCGKKEKAK